MGTMLALLEHAFNPAKKALNSGHYISSAGALTQRTNIEKLLHMMKQLQYAIIPFY
jgi:hypothetical protein